ncbi:MAG: DNA alkylation repair protein [Pseudobdellovibrionaceae bacterium]
MAYPTLKQAQREIRSLADSKKTVFFQKFFRTAPGEYAEGDLFLGLSVPQVRSVALKFRELPIPAAFQLLHSKWHEERLLALIILVERYRKCDEKIKKQIASLYLKNRKFVNNWDLVDASAPQILGASLEKSSRALLFRLANSKSLWDRRIAIVSTFHFIRKNDLKDTFKLSQILLKDQEDLIHKACGWMLREAGKKDLGMLRRFLDQHAHHMPRTMLRYSIEKLGTKERLYYMRRKKN